MAQVNTGIKRPAFTDPQKVQAEYVGRVTDIHRAKRPTKVTHAIDNVTPEVVADRDDGIFVEVARASGKGYQVHVTIADVAAHVRPRSPLCKAAAARAFTVYRPGSTDPMFPRILEENLSLEHGQDRLGLTVSIALDEHFKPMHTSFTPVITNADNASYAQAGERMAKEPQFDLMAKIAEGVKNHYFLSGNAAWSELVEDRRMRRGLSENEINSMDMVAVYMLLANSCVANFFKEAKLPFLYRNFAEQDSHASYGTEALGHCDIKSANASGAYAHITSPIRRAPDYFNGAMMHYVVDVLGAIESKLIDKYSALDSAKLKDGLWSKSSEIMKLLEPTPNHRKAMNQLLADIIKKSASNGLVVNSANVISDLKLPPLPFSKEELQHYADHINALTHSSEMSQVAKENLKFDNSMDRIESIKNKSRDELQALEADKFSSILSAAAVTGEMTTPLYQETIKRMTTGAGNKTDYLYNVFIKAQFPNSEQWRTLKRVAAKVLKKDPSTVNALLTKLQYLVHPDNISMHFEVINAGAHDRISRALLVKENEDGTTMAAPFYSVGHNERAALSHARYSFLEHYAFGELRPVEQTATPCPLYANLNLPDTTRRELIEQMVKDSGATITINHKHIPTGIRSAVIVRGGDVTVPVVEISDGKTEEAATQSALRRILRNEAFNIAMSRHQNIGQNLLNPQILLEELVREKGAKLAIEVKAVSSKSNAGFSAEAVLEMQFPYKRKVFKAIEPNKDRALRKVAAAALVYLGTDTNKNPETDYVASWTSHRDPAIYNNNQHTP